MRAIRSSWSMEVNEICSHIQVGKKCDNFRRSDPLLCEAQCAIQLSTALLRDFFLGIFFHFFILNLVFSWCLNA